MTARRISGWPAWQVVWAAGAVSTAALFVLGATLALETTTSLTCPGAPTAVGSNGFLGVLCESRRTVTTHPHELRGLLIIGVAAVWAVATIILTLWHKPSNPPGRDHEV